MACCGQCEACSSREFLVAELRMPDLSVKVTMAEHWWSCGKRCLRQYVLAQLLHCSGTSSIFLHFSCEHTFCCLAAFRRLASSWHPALRWASILLSSVPGSPAPNTTTVAQTGQEATWAVAPGTSLFSTGGVAQWCASVVRWLRQCTPWHPSHVKGRKSS